VYIDIVNTYGTRRYAHDGTGKFNTTGERLFINVDGFKMICAFLQIKEITELSCTLERECVRTL
jgi:hypothetical protein